MKGTALKPDFFMSKMPSIMKDKEAGEKGADDDERALYALSQMRGWKILEEYIENIIKDLDRINEKAIESGATFDVIGQNAVVINLAKALINKIPTKVHDAKDACERPDGTEK